MGKKKHVIIILLCATIAAACGYGALWSLNETEEETVVEQSFTIVKEHPIKSTMVNANAAISKQKAIAEEEIKAKREAEEKAKREAEEKAKHEAEEKARKEREQAAKTQLSNTGSSGGGSGLTKSGGVNYYNGRKETWYSSRVLYHYRTKEWTADGEGFYRTKEGYYVVAASDMPQGTIFSGSKGTCIVLDSGCAAGITDYYVNW